MAMKSLKVFAACLVVFCCVFHHDVFHHNVTAFQASFLFSKTGSIWIPTRVKGSRHKRFLSKPHHCCVLIQDFSRRGSLVILLLILLSGDVELNPGPANNQVKCVCSVNKESGHMIQCKHCLRWCQSKCVNIAPSLASIYPFVCPSCVKEAVTNISNVKSDISALKSRLSKVHVEEACKHIPTHIKSLGESLDAVSLKVKALPLLSSPNKPMTDFPMLPVSTSCLCLMQFHLLLNTPILTLKENSML